MTVPSPVIPTPNATVTTGMGANTVASSEFWQRTAGGFVVFTGVPYALMKNLLALYDRGGGVIDTAIAQQLAAYPKRIAASTASS